MFDKSLQVEETVQMVWLLYSFEAMDLRKLAAINSNEVGSIVALEWKYINTYKYEPGMVKRGKIDGSIY